MHLRISVLCVCLSVSLANAGYVSFNQTTNCISVNGNTVETDAITIEAEVLIPSSIYPTASGRIFAEQLNSEEDKGLEIGSKGVGAATYPNPTLLASANLAPDVWHHIAYEVYQIGSDYEQATYIDGSLVTSRDLAGNSGDDPISNSPFSTMTIGEYIYRNPSSVDPSFLGDVEWLRVSDIARYTGATYTVPTGVPAADADTQLLFNFENVSPGSSTITDLSANHYVGTVGAGFAGTTAPVFVVPEPHIGMIALSALALCWRQRKENS